MKGQIPERTSFTLHLYACLSDATNKPRPHSECRRDLQPTGDDSPTAIGPAHQELRAVRIAGPGLGEGENRASRNFLIPVFYFRNPFGQGAFA